MIHPNWDVIAMTAIRALVTIRAQAAHAERRAMVERSNRSVGQRARRIREFLEGIPKG